MRSNIEKIKKELENLKIKPNNKYQYKYIISTWKGYLSNLENHLRQKLLENFLKRNGIKFIKDHYGKYGKFEESFIIYNISHSDAEKISKIFNQESVLAEEKYKKKALLWDFKKNLVQKSTSYRSEHDPLWIKFDKMKYASHIDDITYQYKFKKKYEPLPQKLLRNPYYEGWQANMLSLRQYIKRHLSKPERNIYGYYVGYLELPDKTTGETYFEKIMADTYKGYYELALKIANEHFKK